jgi:hypothetical protein
MNQRSSAFTLVLTPVAAGQRSKIFAVVLVLGRRALPFMCFVCFVVKISALKAFPFGRGRRPPPTV